MSAKTIDFWLSFPAFETFNKVNCFTHRFIDTAQVEMAQVVVQWVISSVRHELTFTYYGNKRLKEKNLSSIVKQSPFKGSLAGLVFSRVCGNYCVRLYVHSPLALEGNRKDEIVSYIV